VDARRVAQTAAVATLTVVGVAAALYLLWRIRHLVVLTVLAAFLAVALAPAVAFLHRRARLPRPLAILGTYAGLLGVLFLLGAIVLPPVVDEVETFVNRVPAYAADLRDSATLRDYEERFGLVERLQAEAQKLPARLADAAGELESVTVTVFSRIFDLIVVLVIAFFLLLQGPGWVRLLIARSGPERGERLRALVERSSRAVGGYVAGTFGIAAVTGTVSFLIMTVLGIPFAVPLAVQMAFFALIPLVGSAIGAAIIAFVAVFEGPGTMLLWLAIFIAYQQVESHVLGPMVYRRTVELSPFLVIVVVLIGASWLGILGALLAIPAAATIQLVLRDWWSVREARRAALSGASPPTPPPAGEPA
jgi:predicted PurR-regulated permease PerM